MRYTTIGQAMNPTHASERQHERRRTGQREAAVPTRSLLRRSLARLRRGRVWERNRATNTTTTTTAPARPTTSAAAGPLPPANPEPVPRAALWRNQRTDELWFAEPISRRVDRGGPISSRAAHPSAPR